MFGEHEHTPPVESRFDFKRELRKWVPRIALLAMPFGCGHDEHQELQTAVEDVHHMSDRSDAGHARRSVAVVETQDGTAISERAKALLDQASRECHEESPLLAVALPEPESDPDEAESQELVHMFEEHSESHTHVHPPEKSHVKTNDADESSLLLADHEHPVMGTRETNMLKTHSHVEVFKGAKVVGDYGEAIQEILELDGHIQIPIATTEGAFMVGLEKRGREISGSGDKHAELGGSMRIDLDSLTPDSPAYGYIDVGAGVELSDHGEVWGVNVQMPLDEQREMWGSLHTAEKDHHHGSGEKEADDGEHEGWEGPFVGLSKNVDLGWRAHTADKKGSLTAGYKKGELFYKASLDLPSVKLTLLATASPENQGVFFTASGAF